MIRVLQKNNETLRIGLAQDWHLMKQAVSFQSYDSAVECLRRFLPDVYNISVLRKVLYEESGWRGVHLLHDQEVVAQIARMLVRKQLFVVREITTRYAGGSSSYSEKPEQTEGKKWDKGEYVAAFLKENEPAQKTRWVAFKVLYDDTDEPVADVKLKLILPGGTTNTYTTDGSGRIYISGLPEGMCDIKEMLDSDALEVVEILKG